MLRVIIIITISGGQRPDGEKETHLRKNEDKICQTFIESRTTKGDYDNDYEKKGELTVTTGFSRLLCSRLRVIGRGFLAYYKKRHALESSSKI